LQTDTGSDIAFIAAAFALAASNRHAKSKRLANTFYASGNNEEPANKAPRYRRSGRKGKAMARTVLVVDDDATVLDVLTGMLEALGCHTVTASSGPDALEQLKREDQISVLITDVNMPVMDGNELAELARRIRPELKVLQVSGRERRRDGFPMIRKPFTIDDLARTMAQTTGVC
jgi:CheY-like chemotaxis protein